jgi:hypothetical protein
MKVRTACLHHESIIKPCVWTRLTLKSRAISRFPIRSEKARCVESAPSTAYQYRTVRQRPSMMWSELATAPEGRQRGSQNHKAAQGLPQSQGENESVRNPCDDPKNQDLFDLRRADLSIDSTQSTGAFFGWAALVSSHRKGPSP